MVRGGKQAGPFTLFIMGLIFACAGLAIVYFFGQDIRFECQRSANQCIIEKTNVFGKKEITDSVTLSALAGAEVIESRDSDGDYMYKVILITNEGRIPLSGYSSSNSSSHRKNARLINNYVNSGDENFELKQSGKFVKIFGFVFAGVGVLMLLGSLGFLFKLILLGIVMLTKR